MDRLGGNIDRTESSADSGDKPLMSLGRGDEHLVEASVRHLAVPEELLNLKELECLYEDRRETLWTFMRPSDRPSFTPTMLNDFVNWQRLIGDNFGPGKVPLRFLVLGSRSPGVFCFGGDLELFQQFIREQNRVGLVQYGYRCVEILHRNMTALDLPMLTVGLVEGAALGGGFEALAFLRLYRRGTRCDIRLAGSLVRSVSRAWALMRSCRASSVPRWRTG